MQFASIRIITADVDAEFARLRPSLTDIVLEPTTMSWGNRSTLFRDPDGNLVNLFSRPISGEGDGVIETQIRG